MWTDQEKEALDGLEADARTAAELLALARDESDGARLDEAAARLEAAIAAVDEVRSDRVFPVLHRVRAAHAERLAELAGPRKSRSGEKLPAAPGATQAGG